MSSLRLTVSFSIYLLTTTSKPASATNSANLSEGKGEGRREGGREENLSCITNYEATHSHYT